jgi:hypothetical protein
MEYIPGVIHESLQKEKCFQIELDFSWINCKGKRLNELNTSVDYEKYTDSIDLKKGDIIFVKWFKPSVECYTYLEKIQTDNIIKYYKTETIVSKGLIECNPKMFRDISVSIEREDKINKILNDKDS